jgi:alpha-galactosidase
LRSFLMTGGAGCNSMEPGKRCPGMTETEYRTEFSLWTIGAASMIVSTARKRLFALFYSSKR